MKSVVITKDVFNDHGVGFKAGKIMNVVREYTALSGQPSYVELEEPTTGMIVKFIKDHEFYKEKV